MNDVNELWSSPWRQLQKDLASGYGTDVTSHDILFCAPQAPSNRAPKIRFWNCRGSSSPPASEPRIVDRRRGPPSNPQARKRNPDHRLKRRL